MSIFSSIRRQLRHHASSRGAAVLMALALVMATLPRWEAHSHAVDHHAHDHSLMHAVPDVQDDAPDAEPAPFEVAHLHLVASLAVAPTVAAPLDLAPLPPETWPGPQRGRTSVAPPSRAPHRPPIA